MRKASYNLISESSSPLVITLPNLIVTDLVGDKAKRPTELLTLFDHCVKFSAYRSCGSGYITFLICHTASHDSKSKRHVTQYVEASKHTL